ncbi:hypothetical protein MKZ38_005758 [Zalerion maritima]|uniref:Uncharacterized protein n=1 Tax=Zalerion maritima TaxID=339359 RepID=A0AAD5RKX4_9PEZI|nr:hypothetical protein MKZ38_005758 [Zalerion maritima]
MLFVDPPESQYSQPPDTSFTAATVQTSPSPNTSAPHIRHFIEDHQALCFERPTTVSLAAPMPPPPSRWPPSSPVKTTNTALMPIYSHREAQTLPLFHHLETEMRTPPTSSSTSQSSSASSSAEFRLFSNIQHEAQFSMQPEEIPSTAGAARQGVEESPLQLGFGYNAEDGWLAAPAVEARLVGKAFARVHETHHAALCYPRSDG